MTTKYNNPLKSLRNKSNNLSMNRFKYKKMKFKNPRLK